ncbi:MAG: hypothetical protein COW03_09385 [Cytophagales bacterium CG12_big_fil_rev_8_21_14_0_65_40_12]|nr:MAG: hypothetical protein COW03_09385 [Cytophagales bacterium CG12_big_fil_rev_8_21_14_0_65_40_12]PIW05527.1 MAG: hypothetical protein COW40_03505 [Cytophagales bacterium CG17_big_fil_post_rev_8_21_14_2_50_40_13]
MINNWLRYLIEKNKRILWDKTFRYTVEGTVGIHASNKLLSQKWGAKYFDNDFLLKKKSDTLFILGSGPSINLISDNQWEEISDHDSFGFNYWFLHDFIPDFYMFQMPPEVELHDVTLNMIERVKNEYKHIPIILRGDGNINLEFDLNDNRLSLFKQGEIYLINEYPIHMHVEVDLPILFEYLSVMGMLSFNSISSFVPKMRSSIMMLITLGYQMGYKNIVLCGVDMNSGFEHFYDHKDYKKLYKELGLDIIAKNSMSGFEVFTNERQSKNTVPKYIKYFRDWAYEMNGVKLMIASENTVLYPEIDLYQFRSK